MLTIRCECGEVFHAEERYIGRAIKCWRCGQVLGIGATPPAPSHAGSVESPGPPGASIASGRWRRRRWVIAGVASVAAVIAVAVFLSVPERDQRQRVTPPPMLRPPTDVVSKPAPEPLPPPPVAGPTSGPRFVLEPQEPKAKPPATRLKTGTNIWTALGPSGHGTLRINNGTRYDAAVTLLDADTGTARRFVYLRAREMMTLRAIAPCHCRVFFALGTDWDALAEEFREDSIFSVFDDPLRFSESETENGVEYATFSVTLHPVPEGRAKTTRLSKEELERQLGKRHSRKGV